MPSGTGQSPSTHAAVEVDAQHLRRPQLGPGEQPRVAQQRAVAEVHRDVAGQVVVVALPPQGAGQDDELLAGVRSGISFSAVGVNMVASFQRGRIVSGSGCR